MTIPTGYKCLRKGFSRGSVCLGFWGVEVFRLSEVPAAQVGYAVLLDGAKTGTGNWKKSWLVIGRESLCGDPLFMATDEPGLPVFTAVHGMGLWEPILIAPSINAFFEILERVTELAKGRENPVAFETNPVPKKEVQQFQKMLSDHLGRRTLSFWAAVFEN